MKMISPEQVEKLNELISTINTDKHYWFIRSMGGAYFNEFVDDGFIAIGYNEILLKDLRDLPLREQEAREYTKLRLKENGVELSSSQIAKAAGQIVKFYRYVNVGDLVIVPSFQSRFFAVGVVQTEMYEDSAEHGMGKCPFAKRRKVKWLKIVEKWQLDPKVLLVLGNQQTMSSIDEYSGYIDRKINSIYTKGDKSYLILRVNQDAGLSWDDFYFIADLGELFKYVSMKGGVDADLTKIEMKINVQSPGDILLIADGGNAYLLLIALMALLCLIPGGKVKIWTLEFESKGLGDLVSKIVDAVNSFLDGRQERALRMKERVQKMQIEQAEDEKTIGDGSETKSLPHVPQESGDDNGQIE
jgi:hypothetical protein